MPTISKDTLDNLDGFVEPLVVRQEQLNLWIIRKIAKRIKDYGELLPSDVYTLTQLLKNGADAREINAEIARVVAVQVSEIKKAIQSVAEGVYNDAKPFYDYRKKPFIPFAKNDNLQRVIKAIGDNTAHTYQNIARAQAFMFRDPNDMTKLIPTPAAEAYDEVINKAVQAVEMGGKSYNTVMEKALNDLTNSGLRAVEYEAESGRVHTQRLDTAVRRNVLDGIRQVNQAVQEQIGKEYGADGKVLSAHEAPAPDHAEIQGRVYDNDNYERMNNEQSFQDVKGRQYPAMRRAIGIWNCRHFARDVILEIFEPVYSDADLQDILARDRKGYTDSNGRHYTMYECTQVQRDYETRIRREKEKYIAFSAVGNAEEAAKHENKVKKLMSQYKTFSAACGLSIKRDRIRVRGYGVD